MGKVIVILVMAEEKWQEADFLRKEIEDRGYRVVMLDMGLIGEPQGPCDITRGEVILASGRSPEEVALISDRGKRMPMMVDGAVQKVRQLYSEGHCRWNHKYWRYYWDSNGDKYYEVIAFRCAEVCCV